MPLKIFGKLYAIRCDECGILTGKYKTYIEAKKQAQDCGWLCVLGDHASNRCFRWFCPGCRKSLHLHGYLENAENMDRPLSTVCRYNSMVDCAIRDSRCNKCGWNPEVYQQRVAALREGGLDME